MSEQNVQVTQADFAPCPTCKQYSHSIGDDRLADAFMHFQSMMTVEHKGYPTHYAFTEKTRDAAQVLMTAARHRTRAEPDLVEVLNEAKKRWMLADGCLECNAADVAFWRRVVEFIEEVRRAVLSRADGEGA